MTDKKGPTFAWVCAIVVALISLLVAASAARTVHAANRRFDHAALAERRADGRHAQAAPQTPPINAPSLPRSSQGQSDLAPGDHAQEVTMNRQKRTFLIHVPRGYRPTPSAKPIPLVVMLHGAGGSGKQVEAQTGWDKKADKETFLAVFPDALPARPNRPASMANPRFWHDGSHRGEASVTTLTDVDDVAFIGAVLDAVGKQFPIDEKRVFVTGFSSGASMTFRLLVSPLATRFAAGAPVSGHLWVKNAPESANARRVPALLIWGASDPLNPIAGGKGTGLLAKPSLQADVNAYAAYIGAPDTPALISDAKGVKRVAYGPGKNGAELIVLTVEGAGHVWPGGTSALSEKIVGPSTKKLNATDAIWTFFQRHYLATRSVAP